MIEAEYRGMTLVIEDQDIENLAYFAHCTAGHFHLQQCAACKLLRYPPGPACPWCAAKESTWVPVEGKGTVHTYTQVHHAVQPGFKTHTPYLVLVVDLDTQKGQPTPHEALRVIGNLVTADGELAPPELVQRVGIGSRVTMCFTRITPELAIPNWRLDDEQPAAPPWRALSGV